MGTSSSRSFKCVKNSQVYNAAPYCYLETTDHDDPEQQTSPRVTDALIYDVASLSSDSFSNISLSIDDGGEAMFGKKGDIALQDGHPRRFRSSPKPLRPREQSLAQMVRPGYFQTESETASEAVSTESLELFQAHAAKYNQHEEKNPSLISLCSSDLILGDGSLEDEVEEPDLGGQTNESFGIAVSKGPGGGAAGLATTSLPGMVEPTSATTDSRTAKERTLPPPWPACWTKIPAASKPESLPVHVHPLVTAEERAGANRTFRTKMHQSEANLLRELRNEGIVGVHDLAPRRQERSRNILMELRDFGIVQDNGAEGAGLRLLSGEDPDLSRKCFRAPPRLSALHTDPAIARTRTSSDDALDEAADLIDTIDYEMEKGDEDYETNAPKAKRLSQTQKRRQTERSSENTLDSGFQPGRTKGRTNLSRRFSPLLVDSTLYQCGSGSEADCSSSDLEHEVLKLFSDTEKAMYDIDLL